MMISCLLPIVPSIFSFMTSQRKREAEQGVRWYKAAKRRRESKHKIEADNTLLELARLPNDDQEGTVPCLT